MTTNELLDTWSESGTDFESFSNLITDISNSTMAQPVDLSGATLYHVVDADAEFLKFHVFDNRYSCLNRVPSRTRLSLDKARSNGVTDELIEEIKDGKLMIRLCSGKAHPTSKHLSRDLAARAMLSGESVYDPTEERDAYFMSRYCAVSAQSNAILRKSDDGACKVIALPSKTYCHVRQDILLEIVAYLRKELGEMECAAWHVDNFISQVWLRFPKQAADIAAVYQLPDSEFLVPGVLLETSDTGDCSIRASAFWEFKHRSRGRIGFYERDHRGTITINDIISGVKSKLLPKYTELPKRLVELLTVDIQEPAAAVAMCMKMANGKIRDRLSNRVMKGLAEQLQMEVDGAQNMTGYDIAMLFLDLPARVTNTDGSIKETVEKLAGAVPFLDFDRISKATSTVTIPPTSV